MGVKFTFGRYDAIREKNGLSNYKVAVKAGIAPATISEWEKGRYTPKYDKLFAIATALECSVEDFMEKAE